MIFAFNIGFKQILEFQFMIRKNGPVSLLLITALLIISLSSCDPGKKYRKEEESTIQSYLNLNPSLVFEKQASGLYYLSERAGTGITPVLHDTAYIKYTGKFIDGTVFDSNVSIPDSLIIPVGEGWLIQGIDEGLTLMKKGGKALLLIPSSLAYGASGYYIIAGYTPLLFEIELLKVKQGPGAR